MKGNLIEIWVNMRKSKWSVERVKKSFHEVSPQEMKRKLAEVWEILVNQKSQLATTLLPNPLLVYEPVKSPLKIKGRKKYG